MIVVFVRIIKRKPKYSLRGKCNVTAAGTSISSLLYFLCHVHLLICWTLCATYIYCMCCIETLSYAVSVELSNSHVLYRLNWDSLICCVGCTVLRHVMCCIGCIVWVSLIPLYWFIWLYCVCFTFYVIFIACHPSLLVLILPTQRALILSLSISSTQTSFKCFRKTAKSDY
jgi:hypothetical protein